jgi:tRNA(adenine34) deaminase
MIRAMEQPVFSQEHLYMQQAIIQAQQAVQNDEIPVGAVIIHGNRIIARAYNQVEMLKDPTAHAEMIAITQAANALSCKWLQDCSIYVTLEPCSMCAGALVLARIKRIYYGAADPKAGACGSVMNIAAHNHLNHQVEVSGGLLKEECGHLISQFFEQKRKFNKEIN